MEAEAQVLVDSLRQIEAARLIVPFAVAEAPAEEEGSEAGFAVELGLAELYKTTDNQAGGFSLDQIAELTEEALAPIQSAAVALLTVRFAGKRASGTLLVDEEDRVWGEGVHEEEAVPAAGLRVEL